MGKRWLRIALKGGDDAYVYGPLLSAEKPKPPEPAVVAEKPRPAVTQVAVGVYPSTAALTPGTTFQDCSDCPEMVVVPSGSFVMGSPSYEEDRDYNEGLQHRVTIGKSFAVGVYAVTRGEFSRFVLATSHGTGNSCWFFADPIFKERSGRDWRSPGYHQTRDPVVCIDWDDAQAYVSWLSRQTGKRYRLLSDAEWEYVARAGTSTPFSTGSTISPDQANYNGNHTYGSGLEGVYRKRTVPVDTFSPNAFGLYNVHGNVWEWTQDCWNERSSGAPSDAGARQRGDCSKRVARGGSWANYPRDLRSARRIGPFTGTRHDIYGFRVARTLD